MTEEESSRVIRLRRLTRFKVRMALARQERRWMRYLAAAVTVAILDSQTDFLAKVWMKLF